MALPTDDLINALAKLPTFSDMKVTVKNSMKCGTIVGITTMMSGVLAGPAGVLIGGVVSSLAAGYCSWGQFKSVPHILVNDMTPQQGEMLAKELRKCIDARHIFTIHDFLSTVQNSTEFLDEVTKIVIAFLASQLGMKVIT